MLWWISTEHVFICRVGIIIKSWNLFPSVFLTLITLQNKWQHFQIHWENKKSNLLSEFNENYKVKELRVKEKKPKIILARAFKFLCLSRSTYKVEHVKVYM